MLPGCMKSTPALQQSHKIPSTQIFSLMQIKDSKFHQAFLVRKTCMQCPRATHLNVEIHQHSTQQTNASVRCAGLLFIFLFFFTDKHTNRNCYAHPHTQAIMYSHSGSQAYSFHWHSGIMFSAQMLSAVISLCGQCYSNTKMSPIYCVFFGNF